MRTTIEMKPEHRAKLMEIAARRGAKGFSTVVAEAIESYLAGREAVEERQRRALELRGVLSEEESRKLREAIQELRRSWE